MKLFIKPCKIKTIVLELPNIVKIYPVVNISRIVLDKKQVKGQKLEPPFQAEMNSRKDTKQRKY